MMTKKGYETNRKGTSNPDEKVFDGRKYARWLKNRELSFTVAKMVLLRKGRTGVWLCQIDIGEQIAKYLGGEIEKIGGEIQLWGNCQVGGIDVLSRGKEGKGHHSQESTLQYSPSSWNHHLLHSRLPMKQRQWCFHHHH